MNHEDLRDRVERAITSVSEAQIREGKVMAELHTKVTTGSLGLSLAFVSFVAPFTGLTWAPFLILSWAFLLLALMVRMIAHVFADWHFDQHRDDLRQWRDEGMNVSTLPSDETIWRQCVKYSNYASLLCTFCGLVSLVIFGILNVETMTNTQNLKGDQQEVTQKHADTTVSGPSVSDILSTVRVPSTQDTASSSNQETGESDKIQ